MVHISRLDPNKVQVQTKVGRYGIFSAIQRDNAKSEISQRDTDTHSDLITDNPWTEMHNPLQNPAKLNGV
jgi:hypothetical protein